MFLPYVNSNETLVYDGVCMCMLLVGSELNFIMLLLSCVCMVNSLVCVCALSTSQGIVC